MAVGTLAGANMSWSDGQLGQTARMMFRTGKGERKKLDRAAAGHEAEAPPPKPATYVVDEKVEEEKEDKVDEKEVEEARTTTVQDNRGADQKWWEDSVPYGDSCPGTTAINLNIDRNGKVDNDNKMRPCMWHG